jgi:hypothetical protein
VLELEVLLIDKISRKRQSYISIGTARGNVFWQENLRRRIARINPHP